MILWDLNPVALSLGPLQVRWYGIVYALGFLLGYFALRQAAKRKAIPNLTERSAEDYVLWLMLGSIVTARLVYVIVYNPAFYFANPLEIPAVWHGGMSIHGGILGAAIVSAWFCRKHKIRFYNIADLLVVPLALVLVFGRLANYANGELWGRKTTVPWCVQFPGVDGCRHPSQLYEALYSYILFIVLVVMQETRRFADGVIFWSFITLYGAFRFVVTFWREFDPTDPAILGISLGQWLSLCMIIVGAIWLIRQASKGSLMRKTKGRTGGKGENARKA